MSATTDVAVARSATPRFPRRCVFCGQSNPSATLKIRGYLIRWWTVLLALVGSALWKPHSVDVPVCTRCKTRVRQQQIVRPIVAILVAMAVMAAVSILVGGTAVTIVGLLLVVFVPRRAFAMPLPVEMAVFHQTIEFEFTDAAYAQEFAALNGVALDGGWPATHK